MQHVAYFLKSDTDLKIRICRVKFWLGSGCVLLITGQWKSCALNADGRRPSTRRHQPINSDPIVSAHIFFYWIQF
jgi:hypothetical protein